MTQYQIEDNINFYEELNKSLNDDTDTSTSEILTCLITNLPLEEDHITLNCNHKFNYDAIYHDILNHKTKYNIMERHNLKTNEIRCPYCRAIHKELLPQRDNYTNVNGVNCIINIHSENEYKQGICNYSCCVCTNIFVKLLQLDNNTYCGNHHKIVKIKIMLKQKEEKKEKLKEKLKQKLENKINKTIKLQQLQQLQHHDHENENIILSQLNPIVNIYSCSQILKYGKNKGLSCGCNKLFKEGLCLRHYNLNLQKE